MKLLNIFVSSPGDVTEERAAARAVIEDLSRLEHFNRRFVFHALLYEWVAPPLIGRPPQQTVDEYMATAADADIYICILAERLGTPLVDQYTGRSFASGTEYEFECAYRARKQGKGRPVILLYRRTMPESAGAVDAEQMSRVAEFFGRFEGPDPQYEGLWKHYGSPMELKSELYIDLQNVVEHEFLGDLADEMEIPAEYYHHINLTPHYIVREDVIASIRQALLTHAPTPKAIREARSVPVALHGMGGVGKSVIARALCEDEALRVAFPDGILWAGLQPEADLREVFLAWLPELGAPLPERTVPIETLRNEIGKALADRACLLVVDNVRYAEDVAAFHLGGPRCRLLLTTRDAALAHEIEAQIITLPMMTRDQAVDMLCRWGEHGVKGAEEDLLTDIVQRLGRLPLAIKLAGAQLRNALDPKRWLESFDAVQLRAARPSQVFNPHDSLIDTFELSLAELPAQLRCLYRDLVVLRDVGDGIPVTAAWRLWSDMLGPKAEDSGHRLLLDLADRALIDYLPGDGSACFNIHDLLRDILDRELEDSGSRKQKHRNLIGAYRKSITEDQWSDMEDDGYIYQQLVYHLQGAQALNEISGLLRDDKWMRARLESDEMRYDGFISDLKVALTLAAKETRQQIEAAGEPCALVDCLRLVLVRTSIRSISGNLDPSLILRAVEVGIWSIKRAAAVASEIPRVFDRVSLYTKLLNADLVTEPLARALRWRIVQSVRAAPDDKQTAQAVIVAAQLGDSRVVEPLLWLSLSIQSEGDRADALLALAPQVSAGAIEPLLAAALCFEEPARSVRLICAIAPKLTSAQAERALMSTIAARNRDPRPALYALSKVLPGQAWLSTALEALERLEDGYWKRDTERAILLCAPTAQLEEVLDRFLTSANDGFADVDTLLELLPRINSEGAELDRARGRIVHSLLKSAGRHYQRDREKYFAPIAPYLTSSQVEMALEAVESMKPEVESDVASKARSLAAIAPVLESEKVLRRALDIAKRLFLPSNQAIALGALCPHLSVSMQREVLAFSCETDYDSEIAERLAAIAPGLADCLVTETLDIAIQIADHTHRSVALVALAKRAAGVDRQRIIEAACHEPESQRSELFLALAPGGSQEYFEGVLVALQDFEDWQVRERTLVGMAPNFPPVLRERIVSDWRSLGKSLYWVAAVEALVSGLDPSSAECILEQAARIDDAGDYSDWYLSRIIISLAPHLTPRLVKRALEITVGLTDEPGLGKASAFAALIPYLSVDALGVVIERVLAIGDAVSRIKPLAALAVHPNDTVLTETIESAADSMPADDLDLTLRILAEAREGKLEVCSREDAIRKLRWLMPEPRALTVLAPYLPRSVLTPVIDNARTVHDIEDEVNALVAIPAPLPKRVRETTVRAILSNPASDLRDTMLWRFGSRLIDDNDEGFGDIESIEPESARAAALAGAAASLGRDRQPSAWRIAAKLEDRQMRCKITIQLLKDMTDAEPKQWKAALRQTLTDLDAELTAEPGLWEVLASLGEHMDRDDKSLLLEAAAGVDDVQKRIDAQSTLLPLLSESEQSELASQLLDETLNPPPGLLSKILKGEIPRFYQNVKRTLPKLLPFLNATRVDLAFDRLNKIAGPLFEDLVPMLLPYMRGRRQTKFFERAMQVRYKDNKHTHGLLMAMIPGLSPAQISRVLDYTINLEPGSHQAGLLAALAPRLDQGTRDQLVQAGKQLENAEERFIVLWGTACQCVEKERAELIAAALADALKINTEWRKTRALSILAEHLDAPGADRAMSEVLKIKDEKQRVEAIVKIAPYIDSTTAVRAFDKVLEIENGTLRLEALDALVPQLEVTADWVGKSCSMLLETLLEEISGERRELLRLLQNRHLLGEPLMVSVTSRRIAETISTVCHAWRWL